MTHRANPDHAPRAAADAAVFDTVDHHLTDYGNQVVADTVAAYLIAEGLRAHAGS